MSKANPKSQQPTGMCGSSTKCAGCPSTFLCYMKAKEEMKLIDRKKDGFCPLRDDDIHCKHWWDGGKCCSCDFEGELAEPLQEEIGSHDSSH